MAGERPDPARSAGAEAPAAFAPVLWIYLLAPVAGAVAGAFAYQLVRGEAA